MKHKMYLYYLLIAHRIQHYSSIIMISIAYVKIIYPSSGIYCIYMYIPELKKMSRAVVQAKKIFLWSK